MTIKTVQDPMTNADITMIEGVIQRIMYKPVKNGVDKFGNTHNASVQIDGDWINFISMKVKEGREPQLTKISGQAPNLNYDDIHEGDTVRVAVKVGEYNGKPQYTSGSSKFIVLSKGPGKSQKPTPQAGNTSGAPSASKGNSTKVFGTITDVSGGVATIQDEDRDGNVKGTVKVTLADKEKEVIVGGRLTANIDDSGKIVSGFKAYGPKEDDVGIRVGNSFNVAVDSGLITAKSDITKELPEIVAKIDIARAEAAKANPTLSAKALGGRFGLSIVTASKFAKKGATVEELIEASKPIFIALGQVEESVRNKAATDKLEPSKSVSEAPAPTASTPFSGGTDLDFDDDIPFASAGLQYANHAISALYA